VPTVLFERLGLFGGGIRVISSIHLFSRPARTTSGVALGKS